MGRVDSRALGDAQGEIGGNAGARDGGITVSCCDAAWQGERKRLPLGDTAFRKAMS